MFSSFSSSSPRGTPTTHALAFLIPPHARRSPECFLHLLLALLPPPPSPPPLPHFSSWTTGMNWTISICTIFKFTGFPHIIHFISFYTFSISLTKCPVFSFTGALFFLILLSLIIMSALTLLPEIFNILVTAGWPHLIVFSLENRSHFLGSSYFESFWIISQTLWILLYRCHRWSFHFNKRLTWVDSNCKLSSPRWWVEIQISVHDSNL